MRARIVLYEGFDELELANGVAAQMEHERRGGVWRGSS